MNINILLACSAGMSTSLLEKSIREYMETKGFTGKVDALAMEVAKEKITNYDVVLLGPQVRFMKESFEEVSEGIPLDVIPPADYAMAKGDKVFALARKLAGK